MQITDNDHARAFAAVGDRRRPVWRCIGQKDRHRRPVTD